MQNIFKFKNGSNLRFKVHQYLHYCQDKIKHTGNFPLYSNKNQIFRLFGALSHNSLYQIRREYKAIYSLLIRKNFLSQEINIRKNDYYTFFHNSDINKNRNQYNGSKQTGSSSGQGNDSDKNKNEDQKLAKLGILSIAMFIYISSIMYFIQASKESNTEVSRSVSWNEFVHQMLAKGEVKQLIIRPEIDLVTIILHDGAIVKGQKALFSSYTMSIPHISLLEEKVRQEEERLGIKHEMGIPIIYERSSPSLNYMFMIFIVGAAILYFIAQSSIKNFNFPTNMFSQMTRAKFTLIDPLTGGGKGVRFSDVAGLQEAKTEIMEFVDYLKSPDRYKTLGAKVPKGALLLGPPGCGKTLLAKAIATESNVPFLSMNGSEFIEMIGGLGAARVRNLFKEGKRRAPSIIYIDEIDAIGKKRSTSSFDRSNGESEQTLNQLLTEMDGMVSNQEVIVLASTNRAEVLDKALLRPGRFDRHILIDLPTLNERQQIFEQHLKGISLDKSPSVFSKRLAFLTPGFSGADIANICNEAALHAARLNKKLVTGNDLLYAVDRVIAGTEKREHAITPSEKTAIAYHEAGHALVGWMLEHTDALLKVTIVPRTNRALGFTQFTTSDKKLFTREQLFERMCMMLGGRVAESLTFNKVTTGAVNDLEKVTKIAYAEVQQYGMDKIVGPLSFLPEQLDTKTRKPYSKMLGNTMDQEARTIIAQVYKKTEKLLMANKDKLKTLAEALLEKETLTYEEIEKLIGPPPFGKKKLIESVEFESTVPVPEAPSESAREKTM